MNLTQPGHDILVYIVFSYFLLGENESDIPSLIKVMHRSCLRMSDARFAGLAK
jgi:hypothetical protein